MSENVKFGRYEEDADAVDRGMLKAERKIKRDKVKNKQKTKENATPPNRR
jgi:hypothetical protein